MLHVAPMLARFAIASNTPYDHPCNLETAHRHPPQSSPKAGWPLPTRERNGKGQQHSVSSSTDEQRCCTFYSTVFGASEATVIPGIGWGTWSRDVFIRIFHSRHFSSILTVWPMIASFGLVAKYIVTMLRNHVQCSLSKTNRKFAMKGKRDRQVGIHLVVQE